MANLVNSHSLTDFQRNARTLIETINETHEPLLLTVNGKVQAVLVDPVTYQQAEEQLERARLIAAVREGEQAVREGRTRPAEEVFTDLKAKSGLTSGGGQMENRAANPDTFLEGDARPIFDYSRSG